MKNMKNIRENLKKKSVNYSDNISPNSPDNMSDETLWSNINAAYLKGVDDTIEYLLNELKVNDDKSIEIDLLKFSNNKLIKSIGVVYNEDKVCTGVKIRID